MQLESVLILISVYFYFRSPGWSQVGVVTALVTADETECQTYHLTSFAVLMKTGKFEIGVSISNQWLGNSYICHLRPVHKQIG